MKHKKELFVSVVIPAYNEEKFIPTVLKCLKNQDYKGNFEVIVVNNACSDKTAEIAESYGAKVIFQPIKGLRYTRELGFAEAKGSLIASTDADITLPENWLSRLVSEVTKDENTVAVSGWFRLEKGPVIPRYIINYLSAPTLFLYQIVFDKSIILDPNFIVKKSAYIKSGGFTDLDSMNEDLLLAQRLKKFGRVKMHLDSSWTVVSSPRRWMNGFVPGASRYFANAVYFALFDKLVFRDFTDVRSEKPTSLKVKIQLAYAMGVVGFTAAIFMSQANPIMAKVSPIKNRVTYQINKSIDSIQKLELDKENLPKFIYH